MITASKRKFYHNELFVSTHIFWFLAVTAWGTACFELSPCGLYQHFAVADLWNTERFSAVAFAAEQTVERTVFFGLTAGFVLFGILADRFGRGRILLLCLCLTPLFSGLVSISFSPSDFLFWRFLTGASCSGLFLNGTLLLYEQRDAVFRRIGLCAIPCVALLLSACFALLPILPVLHWRASFAGTMLPLVLLPFFCQYYDEPYRWKIAVRDKHSFIPRQHGGIRKYRLLFWGCVLTFCVIICLRHPFYSGIPSSDFLQKFQEEFEGRLDDRIIAYLIRYPQLLDTQESGQFDWQNINEKLTSRREVPRAVFDGLLMLHREKRPINRQNLLDYAVAAWDKNRGNIRPATNIPLNEIEAFYQTAGRYLDDTQNKLESFAASQLADQNYQSAADQWKRRNQLFKELLGKLQRQTEQQYYEIKTAEQRFFFHTCFVCSLLIFWFYRYFPCFNILWIFPQCFITSRRGTYCGITLAAVLSAVLFAF